MAVFSDLKGRFCQPRPKAWVQSPTTTPALKGPFNSAGRKKGQNGLATNRSAPCFCFYHFITRCPIATRGRTGLETIPSKLSLVPLA